MRAAIAARASTVPRPARRVAVLVDRLRVGGVEKAAIEEVRGLQEIGAEATLLVLKRDDSIPEAFRDQLVGVNVEFLEDRLPRFMRSAWRIPGFYFFSIFHLIYAVALPLRVKTGEWDAILSHNSFTTFTAWTLWKVKRIPYSMYVWDPSAAILRKVYTDGVIRLLRPILLPLARMVDRILARGSYRVLVSSNSYVGYLQGLLPPRALVTIVPPGCYPAISPRTKAGNYLLTATSWKEGKQLEVLLAALAMLPGARLIVAGRWMHEAYRERMDSTSRALGLEDRVSYLGEYDEAEMAGLAWGALCAVTVNAELGFGMPALEAAAQACTFVCPRASGVASHFVEGVEAYYFNEGDAAGLAAVLIRLVQDPDLALRAGLAAWERARSTLTWRHHVEAVALALGVEPQRTVDPT